MVELILFTIPPITNTSPSGANITTQPRMVLLPVSKLIRYCSLVMSLPNHHAITPLITSAMVM